MTGFLGDETLREMLGALTKKAAGLLDESKDVWQVWIEWEQSKGYVQESVRSSTWWIRNSNEGFGLTL